MKTAQGEMWLDRMEEARGWELQDRFYMLSHRRFHPNHHILSIFWVSVNKCDLYSTAALIPTLEGLALASVLSRA